MRTLIMLTLAGVAGLLSGCVYTGVYEANGRPVTSPFSDSPEPHKIYSQYVLKYPDESMFFFPNSDEPPHADLNLLSISCDRRNDGLLVVTARVRNQGSGIVPAAPFVNGDIGAFRVSAVVTTADGVTEEINAVQVVPMTVTGTVDLALGPTRRAQAADVVGVDVVVDPDRVVPDPLRDNNVLSWRGAMQAPKAECSVMR